MAGKGPQNSNITSSDNPLIQKQGPWAQGKNQRLEVGGYQQAGRSGAVDKNSMPFGGGKKAGNSGAVAGRGQESSTYQSPQARAGQSGGGGGGKTSNIESADNPMLANRGKGGWGGLYEPKQVDSRVNQQVISGQVVDGQQQYQQREYQGQQAQYAQQQPINQEQVYQQLDRADNAENLLKYEQSKQQDQNQYGNDEEEDLYQQGQQAGNQSGGAVNTTAQMFKGYVQQGRGQQQQQKYQQFPVGDEIFNPQIRAAGATSTEMEHIEQIQNRARPLGRGAAGAGIGGRGDSKTSNVTSADSPFADYQAGGIHDRNQQMVGGQSYQQQYQQEYQQRSTIPQLREQRAAGATSAEMERIQQIQNQARPSGRGAGAKINAGSGAGRGDSKFSNIESEDSPLSAGKGGYQQQQGRGGQAAKGKGDPRFSNQTIADSPFASGGGW
ncbi:MAG: hypothetical protein EZS28_007216 [Streblomastix strix]|uniref:Uncharacterized protein n=1 Tax=Streblomastix strix TaxID=222440 RepID=A0A5J4WRR1_9EUKA|nr:MAG: hypothetical protein EZS28_007216 [Streblomastix strix]